MNLEELINLGSQYPEIFQAGFIVGVSFVFIFMIMNSVCSLIGFFANYIIEKARAIKIENDKKSPPKKLFANLFKKKERIKNGQDTDFI